MDVDGRVPVAKGQGAMPRSEEAGLALDEAAVSGLDPDVGRKVGIRRPEEL